MQEHTVEPSAAGTRDWAQTITNQYADWINRMRLLWEQECDGPSQDGMMWGRWMREKSEEEKLNNDKSQASGRTPNPAALRTLVQD